MTTEITLPSELADLVAQKLKAFEEIQVEFETSFLFIVNVHGKQRFPALTVSDVVRYLHALWMTNKRTSLLSVSKSIKTYEGLLCLDLLQHWQQDGDTAQVVAFLYRKLDGVSCVEITRQIHEAEELHLAELQVQRLRHGREVLLNRSMNLTVMLDALFSLSEEALAKSVREACVLYGHLPEQIEQQRAAMQSPLYAYVPHQILAERNMRVMNTLGQAIVTDPADKPSQRAAWIQEPQVEASVWAETVIPGYQSLSQDVPVYLAAQSHNV
jgi:hypothetical protein